MFCPVSGVEYIAGIADGSDCGAPLITGMPQSGEDALVDYLTVQAAEAWDPAQAETVWSLPREHNFPGVWKTENESVSGATYTDTPLAERCILSLRSDPNHAKRSPELYRC